MLQRLPEPAVIDNWNGSTGIRITPTGDVIRVAMPTTEYNELFN